MKGNTSVEKPKDVPTIQKIVYICGNCGKEVDGSKTIWKGKIGSDDHVKIFYCDDCYAEKPWKKKK